MHVSATVLRNRLLNRTRLRHLQVFVRVAELHGVKRAADAMSIAQPSATQALADLEQLLEVRLFLRHANGMSLTPAGRLLLPVARRMMGLVDEAATQAADLIQGRVGVVRVAAISAAIGSALGEAVPAFARQHPEIQLHVTEADSLRQATLIGEGTVDCAICRRPAVLPTGWGFQALWADSLCIVAGPSHPLASKRRVSMKDLLANVWLVPPISLAVRPVFDEFFSRATDKVRFYSVTSASSGMMWQLLTQEPLLSLVPLSVMQSLIDARQLVRIAWREPIAFGDIGIMAPEQERGEALDTFLHFMQLHALGRTA